MRVDHLLVEPLFCVFEQVLGKFLQLSISLGTHQLVLRLRLILRQALNDGARLPARVALLTGLSSNRRLLLLLLEISLVVDHYTSWQGRIERMDSLARKLLLIHYSFGVIAWRFLHMNLLNIVLNGGALSSHAQITPCRQLLLFHNAVLGRLEYWTLIQSYSCIQHLRMRWMLNLTHPRRIPSYLLRDWHGLVYRNCLDVLCSVF